MGYSRNKDLIKPHPFNIISSQPLGSNQNDGIDDHQHEKNGSGEFSDQQKMIMVRSRWNPTPEQLLALEELYRRGTRTPSTEQIQHIASRLRRFGKIEGKNVFYWFQNHKARERQKHRREGERNHEQPCFNDVMEGSEKKESGLRRICNAVEQTKNWASSSSTCSKLTEELISVSNGTESGRESEGHKHATWQNPKIIRTPSQNPPSPSNMPRYCFITPPIPKPNQVNLSITNLEEETREIQTLELFPVHNKNDDENKGVNDNITKGETNLAYTLMITPSQYYEFIPLKN